MDNQSPGLFGQTPWQTVGPFFHYALPWDGDSDLTARCGPGEAVEVAGRVLDGEGQPVSDALIEIWQGGEAFGRASTGEDGGYRFRTNRTEHIALGVMGRGIIKRLVTRLYFEEADDPVLSLVPPERRHTLLARCENGVWRFDIVLRGAHETVFFDC